jgi:hypothetical protein
VPSGYALLFINHLPENCSESGPISRVSSHSRGGQPSTHVIGATVEPGLRQSHRSQNYRRLGRQNVTASSVEAVFRRDAGIRATEDGGERVLARSQGSRSDLKSCLLVSPSTYPCIARQQQAQRLGRGRFPIRRSLGLLGERLGKAREADSCCRCEF